MPLKSKFIILLAIVLISVTMSAWYFTEKIVSAVNARWAFQFSQRQVQFDKHRTLMPLIREIALARQLAVEPSIILMAKNEQDARTKKKAIDVLERYRNNFRDHSYFFVPLRSGNYYYNDAQNSFAGRELRYQLSRDNRKDQWFYATIKSSKAYQINLEDDVKLGVSKVWINVLVESGNEVLGMIGTGIDITSFLKETVDTGQEGIHNIFIDNDMAVQLYRDATLIDYASITKSAKDRKQVDAILTNPHDIDALKKTMSRLKSSPYQIETIPVTFKGLPYMLGVAYLPEIGWYDLTLMDTKDTFMLQNFFLLPVGFLILMLLASLAFGVLLSRSIIRPVMAINAAANAIESGWFDRAENLDYGGTDEIGEVTRAFRKMASALKEYTSMLENMVAQRTADLEKTTEELKRVNEDLQYISRTDRLTQISNRHDLLDRLEIEASRSKRSHLPFGIVMLDLDHFKQVNDHYGHHAGDVVLTSVASTISKVLRLQDVFGRWGGEEFLILLTETTLHGTQIVAEKIRELVADMRIRVDDKTIFITTSQGVSVFLPEQNQDVGMCVKQADKALYQAKSNGRNQVVAFEI